MCQRRRIRMTITVSKRISLFTLLLACIDLTAYGADLQGSSTQDAYIAGQLTAILERELGWDHHATNLR